MVRSEFTADKILEGVREIFATKGFDACSMQDLAKGVGMSVGNFYRYFPSKSAIVDALARKDLETIEAEFLAIAKAGNSHDAFQNILRQNMSSGTEIDAAIWFEIEAAASRSPEIATKIKSLEDTVEAQLITAFSAAFSIPLDEARAAFGDQAKIIRILVHGILKSRIRGPIPSSLIEACISQVDHIFTSSAQAYFAAATSKGS